MDFEAEDILGIVMGVVTGFIFLMILKFGGASYMGFGFKLIGFVASAAAGFFVSRFILGTGS